MRPAPPPSVTCSTDFNWYSYVVPNRARDDTGFFPGLASERVPPVPIPNTVVKPFSADGTARVTVWESRSTPGILLPVRVRPDGYFFCPANTPSGQEANEEISHVNAGGKC